MLAPRALKGAFIATGLFRLDANECRRVRSTNEGSSAIAGNVCSRTPPSPFYGLNFKTLAAVPTIEERLALARRHVEAARLTIVRQRQMVEKFKAKRRDTKAAEELLAVLERTQKVFERDLAELEKKRW